MCLSHDCVLIADVWLISNEACCGNEPVMISAVMCNHTSECQQFCCGLKVRGAITTCFRKAAAHSLAHSGPVHAGLEGKLQTRATGLRFLPDRLRVCATTLTDDVQCTRVTCFMSLLKKCCANKRQRAFNATGKVNTSQTRWSVSQGGIGTHASIRSKQRGVSSPRAARSQP